MRVSAEEAYKTRQRIIDAALFITLEEGFESITLSSVGRRAGISKSGVNGHFRYRADIGAAIKIPIIDFIVTRLSFESPSAFYQSWINALSDPKFMKCVRSLNWIMPMYELSEWLVECIKGDTAESEDAFNKAIGFSLVEISRQEANKVI